MIHRVSLVIFALFLLASLAALEAVSRPMDSANPQQLATAGPALRWLPEWLRLPVKRAIADATVSPRKAAAK